MDSIRSMNSALNYIEEHLTEDIDYRQVARIAHCSEYHFKRMFSFLSGVGLSEYVRRRRLTLAATDLKDSTQRIIDVATKYRYTSADAFSRAFQSVHGILPSEARVEGARLKAFPKMTFQISMNGADEMNYRIVEKGPFSIVGIKKRVPIVFEGINPEIAKMTQLLTIDSIMKLKSLSDVEPAGIISASANFSDGRMDEKGELDHYIGVATTSDDTMGFDSLVVAGQSLGRLDRSQRPFRTCGRESTRSGSRHLGTSPLRAQRSPGTRAQTSRILSTGARSGFP